MSEDFEFPRGSWLYEFDSFGSELNNFERDVHMLILSTLDAGITNQTAEAQKHDDELKPHIENASDTALGRISEIQQDIWGYVGDQERFLRNMGLVALVSRLIHALNVMARSAENLGSRNKDGYEGRDEFKQLWNEYKQRFGITFAPQHIQFIDPLRKARNMIVHKGGEANPPKALEDMELNAGDEGLYDLSFSKKYPQLITGEGYAAEVSITQEHLEAAVEKSVNLVRYVSGELRSRELDVAKQEEADGLWSRIPN